MPEINLENYIFIKKTALSKLKGEVKLLENSESSLKSLVKNKSDEIEKKSHEISILKGLLDESNQRLQDERRSREDDRLERWMMLACITFGTSNTQYAMDCMEKAGAKIGLAEKNAAKRLNSLIENWAETIDADKIKGQVNERQK